MSVGVYQAGHQNVTAQINDRSVTPMDRCVGNLLDAVVFNKDFAAFEQSASHRVQHRTSAEKNLCVFHLILPSVQLFPQWRLIADLGRRKFAGNVPERVCRTD